MNFTTYSEPNAVQIQRLVQTLLEDELGTFANGEIAISIEPPASPAPGTGLHVIVSRYSGQMSKSLDQWQVVLRQYDRTLAGIKKLDAAIAKMRLMFPDRREQIPSFNENTYPQATVLISAYQNQTGSGLAYMTPDFN